MSPQPPGPPAAWYPDPGGSGRLRYFNGSGWTDQYADQYRAQPPPQPAARSGRSRRPLIIGLIVVGLAAVVLWLVFVPKWQLSTGPAADKDAFLRHLGESGVPYSTPRSPLATPPIVDDAQNACLGMRTGNSGDLEIANPRWGQYSKGEAEIIVYWAITDLCPDQISKRNDQWKTGS